MILKGVPSTPPTVQTRLSKPKTNVNIPRAASRSRRSASSSSRSRDVSPDHRAWIHNNDPTSHRPSNVRQQLRQQLSNTFPVVARKSSREANRRISQDSMYRPDTMGVKDKFTKGGPALAVGSNASAKSSSSTVNSVGPTRRLSVLQEGQTIDVEAAINLLQELKKNASPEELVALHRALLPTREVETVSSPTIPEESSEYGSPFFNQPSTRRASRLPPGLATRGGTDEDVLRKQGEISIPKRKPKPIEQTLTWSPSERQPISPASTMAALDLAEEIVARDVSRSHTPSDFAYSHTGAYAPGTLRIMNGAASPEPGMLLEHLKPDTYGMMPTVRASLDFHPGRQTHDHAPIREHILHPARTRPRHEQDHAPSPIVPVSLEPQRTHLQIVTNVNDQDSDPDTPSPVSSPVESRSLQGSSYRISAASAEYTSDCDIAESPYEARTTLKEFASRLSTVYGEDQDADDEQGTPDDALSKLTGASRANTLRGPRRSRSRSLKSGRPGPMVHTDSGYGSEAYQLSGLPTQHFDSTSPENGTAFSTPQRESYTAVMEMAAKPSNMEADDARSLYTFTEFLTSPTAISAEATSSPVSPPSRKLPRLMALRSRSSKRSSLPNLPSPVAQQSSESVATLASTQSETLVPERSSRSQRKLQKAMPQHLKERMVLRKNSLEHAATAEYPSVPEMVTKTWEQRLETAPSMAHLQRTYAAIGTTESQEDLLRTNGELADVRFPSPNVEPAEPSRKPSTGRSRSFSRGRKSRNTSPIPVEPSSETKQQGFISRLRSRSRSKSRARNSVDSKANESAPVVDFGTVSQSLGSSPYDPSTIQFRQLHSAGGKGAQSPWQIGNPLLKSTKSNTGMNEERASELARLKSRDMAGHDMVPSYDRPRMATPKQRNLKNRSNSDTRPQRSVEDFIPEWHQKGPVGPPVRPHMPKHFSMYAESIPPMPDLPTDIIQKAAKADEIMHKRMGAGTSGSPARSARASVDGTQLANSTGTTPEKAKRGLQAKKQQDKEIEEEQQENKKSLELLHPAVRPKFTEADVEVEVRELSGSSSDQSGGEQSRPNTAENVEEYAGAPISPSHDAQHPGWPGWEQQAKLWRQRRISLGTSLAKAPVVEEEDEPANAARPGLVKSPSIVVSRYITPLSVDTAARANAGADPTSNASRHADQYINLLDQASFAEDDKENRAAKQNIIIPRSGSSLSSATFVTVQTSTSTSSNSSSDPRPAKREIPRSDSAFSTSTYTTTTTSISNPRSTTSRTTTSTSTSRPAVPAHAYSLSRLTGDNSNNSPPLSPSKGRNVGALVDRYSGGLQYEWARESGFGGSAGTRSSGNLRERQGEGNGNGNGNWKGRRLAEDFGVDLGDVPVFLRRG